MSRYVLWFHTNWFDTQVMLRWKTDLAVILRRGVQTRKRERFQSMIKLQIMGYHCPQMLIVLSRSPREGKLGIHEDCCSITCACILADFALGNLLLLKF